MAMDFKARIRSLQESLAKHRVDAMLLTHMPNVRYLCGFTGKLRRAAGRPQNSRVTH